MGNFYIVTKPIQCQGLRFESTKQRKQIHFINVQNLFFALYGKFYNYYNISSLKPKVNIMHEMRRKQSHMKLMFNSFCGSIGDFKQIPKLGLQSQYTQIIRRSSKK